MHYITLDLEWNQAYAQKAIAVQRQLSCRLRGEVIQIGAVKLDEAMKPIGSYQIIVKPKYFKKIHKHVSELTEKQRKDRIERLEEQRDDVVRRIEKLMVKISKETGMSRLRDRKYPLGDSPNDRDSER